MKLHIVPARTGLEWVRLGIRVFWRQPMALAALFVVPVLAILAPVLGAAMATHLFHRNRT